MALYFESFEKSFDFDGRARRSEYWVFQLGNICLGSLCVWLDAVLGLYIPLIGFGPVTVLFLMMVMVPSLSLTVRRFHDYESSGWWWLTFLIPVVGLILQVIFMSVEGTKGPNKYGPDPLASERSDAQG
ncbi:DUF805 domain-containing protein [Pseudomonas syringae]|uniref:DUF805 domain-containing protein n=1 Tax=Pseudomonas syringae TaxID=317 RepID=A0A085UY24_PSESX|nr:DUF805 domain-containing protein [Pseudomonas syringae]KFE48087.1 hypothetical protein IV02_22370 [Pseudomonas syringae]